jgi:hypothetical protein
MEHEGAAVMPPLSRDAVRRRYVRCFFFSAAGNNTLFRISR